MYIRKFVKKYVAAIIGSVTLSASHRIFSDDSAAIFNQLFTTIQNLSTDEQKEILAILAIGATGAFSSWRTSAARHATLDLLNFFEHALKKEEPIKPIKKHNNHKIELENKLKMIFPDNERDIQKIMDGSIKDNKKKYIFFYIETLKKYVENYNSSFLGDVIIPKIVYDHSFLKNLNLHDAFRDLDYNERIKNLINTYDYLNTLENIDNDIKENEEVKRALSLFKPSSFNVLRTILKSPEQKDLEAIFDNTPEKIKALKRMRSRIIYELPENAQWLIVEKYIKEKEFTSFKIPELDQKNVDNEPKEIRQPFYMRLWNAIALYGNV